MVMPANAISMPAPQIKICGLTHPDEAHACAGAGADAIGFIFYPPSPRSLSAEAAGRITSVLPENVCPVGVFVNEPYDVIMRVVATAGLRAAQLHGRESPALVKRLQNAGLKVIKALFFNGTPNFDAINQYAANAYLVECVGGPLPGGNALSWNWSAASALSAHHPVVLAGGLSPDNIAAAIDAARPDAVDVSSGVEHQPGQKDLAKVAMLCETIARTRLGRQPRNIFISDRSRPSA